MWNKSNICFSESKLSVWTGRGFVFPASQPYVRNLLLTLKRQLTSCCLNLRESMCQDTNTSRAKVPWSWIFLFLPSKPDSGLISILFLLSSRQVHLWNVLYSHRIWCVGGYLASGQVPRTRLVLRGICSHERLFVLGAMVSSLHKNQ